MKLTKCHDNPILSPNPAKYTGVSEKDKGYRVGAVLFEHLTTS